MKKKRIYTYGFTEKSKKTKVTILLYGNIIDGLEIDDYQIETENNEIVTSVYLPMQKLLTVKDGRVSKFFVDFFLFHAISSVPYFSRDYRHTYPTYRTNRFLHKVEGLAKTEVFENKNLPMYNIYKVKNVIPDYNDEYSEDYTALCEILSDKEVFKSKIEEKFKNESGIGFLKIHDFKYKLKDEVAVFFELLSFDIFVDESVSGFIHDGTPYLFFLNRRICIENPCVVDIFKEKMEKSARYYKDSWSSLFYIVLNDISSWGRDINKNPYLICEKDMLMDRSQYINTFTILLMKIVIKTNSNFSNFTETIRLNQEIKYYFISYFILHSMCKDAQDEMLFAEDCFESTIFIPDMEMSYDYSDNPQNSTEDKIEIGVIFV